MQAIWCDFKSSENESSNWGECKYEQNGDLVASDALINYDFDFMYHIEYHNNSKFKFDNFHDAYKAFLEESLKMK